MEVQEGIPLQGGAFDTKLGKTVTVSPDLLVANAEWLEVSVRSPDEEEKPPEEPGTYLHPELYGQPESRGLTYTLGGTIGQADANAHTGGTYTLTGGFWPGGETVVSKHDIYLPLVLK